MAMKANYDCPYPPAEDRPTPGDSVEMLAEELQLYKDPESLRSSVIGLSRMYERTKLLQGFQRYARLITIASTVHDIPSANPDNGIDSDFYSGEVLATHCVVRVQPYITRRQLYSWDPMPQDDPDEETDVDTGEGLRHTLDQIAEFRSKLWETYFNQLDESSQEKLTEATLRLYAGKPNASRQESSFMAGFLFAAVAIGKWLDD